VQLYVRSGEFITNRVVIDIANIFYEHHSSWRGVAIRPHLRALIGGQATLRANPNGYLDAEVTGDYAGLIKMCGITREIGVVAGRGFEPLTFGL
jgi:hypothetical protein